MQTVATVEQQKYSSTENWTPVVEKIKIKMVKTPFTIFLKSDEYFYNSPSKCYVRYSGTAQQLK